MVNLNDSAVGCFAQGKEGDLLGCVLDGLFAAGPSESLMGLLLAGVLMTSLYIAGDGTVAVPAVVTILLGVVLVPADGVRVRAGRGVARERLRADAVARAVRDRAGDVYGAESGGPPRRVGCSRSSTENVSER